MNWRDNVPSEKQLKSIAKMDKCLGWDCAVPKNAGDASILISAMVKGMAALVENNRQRRLKESSNPDCNYIGSGGYCVDSDVHPDDQRISQEDDIEDGDWLEENDLPDEETEW